MKSLDRYLQKYRLRMATPHIKPQARILDIGCFDEATWQDLPQFQSYTGIDPNLPTQQVNPAVRFVRGYFPKDLQTDGHSNHSDQYDLILMLAVLEHIPLEQWTDVVEGCFDLLADGGKIVVTIPSPFVDNILSVLKFLRLIDGMDIDQHQHVQPTDVLPAYFGQRFRLLLHRRFQLGLNHLFVYEKV